MTNPGGSGHAGDEHESIGPYLSKLQMIARDRNFAVSTLTAPAAPSADHAMTGCDAVVRQG